MFVFSTKNETSIRVETDPTLLESASTRTGACTGCSPFITEFSTGCTLYKPVTVSLALSIAESFTVTSTETN